MGSRLGAGLMNYSQAHPGTVRRANMRTNQRGVPPPFIMRLTALALDPRSPGPGTESGLTVPNGGGSPGGLRRGVPKLAASGRECATMSKSTRGVRDAAGVPAQGKCFPRGSSRNRSCALRHNTAPSPSSRTSAGMVVIPNLSLRAKPRPPVASAWSIAAHGMVEK